MSRINKVKTSLIFLLVSAGLTLSCAKEVALNTQVLKSLQQNHKVLQDPNIQQIEGLDRGSYYFLQLHVAGRGGAKKVNAFIDKATGALYTGNRYGKNGTRAIYPVSAEMKKVVNEAVAFSSGHGKKHLYVVTDPECRYCVKFENMAHGKLSDYTIHTILYPLSNHGNAPMMVEWILQAADSQARKKRMDALMVEHTSEWKSVIKNGTFNFSPAVSEQIQKAYTAGRALGITGTPTVLDEDFNKINWMSLFQGH